MEETGEPGENHRLTPNYWQLSHMPKIPWNISVFQKKYKTDPEELKHYHPTVLKLQTEKLKLEIAKLKKEEDFS